MSARPQFSVVTACHQTAPYLPMALDSIAKQKFCDFEAICYVEESTDSSMEICREYAAHDARFRVVSAPKSGAVSSTRNYGIGHAHGDYLVFLDGDDWLADDMLERIAQSLTESGEVDVMAFSMSSTTTDKVDWNRSSSWITNFRPEDEHVVFTGLDAIRKAGRNGGSMHNYTVMCVYRTTFLRECSLLQKPGRIMEDFEWTPRVWYHAKRFAYVHRSFYAYRRRPGSLTTEASSRAVSHLAEHFNTLAQFASECRPPQDIMAIWSNQWLSVLYWFLFHPVTSRKVSDRDRREAIRALFAGGGKDRFLAIAAHATKPKRIAAKFLLLAAHGWVLPAKIFFWCLYYPLAARRR